MRRCFFSLVLLVSCTCSSISQSLGLTISPFSAPDCSSAIAGETWSFSRADCQGLILIERDGIQDTLIAASEFDYTFNLPGQYTFYCGAPDSQTSRTAITAACFAVSDQIVPTVGEWGVIHLTIIMAIILVLSVQSTISRRSVLLFKEEVVESI